MLQEGGARRFPKAYLAARVTVPNRVPFSFLASFLLPCDAVSLRRGSANGGPPGGKKRKRKRKACSQQGWKHQLDSIGCFGIFLDDIIIIALFL